MPSIADDEVQTLIRLVRRAIDDDRYPMAPRLDPLKTLLAKLDPPKTSRAAAAAASADGCGAESRAIPPMTCWR